MTDDMETDRRTTPGCCLILAKDMSDDAQRPFLLKCIEDQDQFEEELRMREHNDGGFALRSSAKYVPPDFATTDLFRSHALTGAFPYNRPCAHQICR